MLRIVCDRCGDVQMRVAGTEQEGAWLQVAYAEDNVVDICPTCRGEVQAKNWRPGLLKALLALTLLVSTITSFAASQHRVAAHETRACPFTMGEPCPKHYGHDLCNSLAYDVATAADVYDVDFLLHSAGCNQRRNGTWVRRSSDACARRAYWLVQHGYSLLRTREKLAVRGCGQFEDGTYYQKGW